ncbi:MAG: sugar transferase [Paludibacteraceae bacterium]|nr:sugar transferase [Paludibacteraceae bacterium]
MAEKLLYKPFSRWIVNDVLILTLGYLFVLWVLPLHAQEPFRKYLPVIISISVTWLIVSYLFGRYRYHAGIDKGYVRTALLESYTLLICFALNLPWLFIDNRYSLVVMASLMLFFASVFFIVTGIRFAYLYASDPEEIPQQTAERAPVAATEHRILYRQTQHISSIAQLPAFQYDCIVEQTPLDTLRGINRLLAAYNAILPDGGELICRFKDKSTKKKEFLAQYPRGIRWIRYAISYCWHRIFPKLFLTKRFYYDVTQGRHRILSKTEVLGRLCYNGYEIVDECKADGMRYIRAKRIGNAPAQHKRRYGPIISLNRVGKNHQKIQVYKFRTMYPYSEFLQGYIYQKYNLQEGGKFNHDIRVNGEGRFMRKYWIDELPMLTNWLRGDLKLVGVRPLSQQYFGLYDSDLQELRCQFKPGLLPPYYADNPKTLEEIQESERKYLNLCVKNGLFATDFVYFHKILWSILFKRVRSK